ncbi:hypothetical protein AYR66_25860 [Noviherbaspirillum denitrificans]|uniref:Uncharacterized protein n=1 Tax=Noviherbaspirillum denitrificans TaxID=1968433 RepID=A0A254TIE9_9BURK|nr:hypothetical protein AYR66_25860 [Noviherbaspirillum denitrificans]
MLRPPPAAITTSGLASLLADTRRSTSVGVSSSSKLTLSSCTPASRQLFPIRPPIMSMTSGSATRTARVPSNAVHAPTSSTTPGPWMYLPGDPKIACIQLSSQNTALIYAAGNQENQRRLENI